MVCEAVSGYICKMMIRAARGRGRRTQFCHMRTKGGIPPYLDWEGHHLKIEQSGDVMVRVWTDKDLSKRGVIYDAKVVKARRKFRRADLEIKILRLLSVQ